MKCLATHMLAELGTSELVRKEITGIEELLEEEPESRCTYPVSFSDVSELTTIAGSCLKLIGCLESLVYYKRLLITLLTEQESQRSEREKLTLDCLGMIEKLEEVDSMRKMRYQDLSKLRCSRIIVCRCSLLIDDLSLSEHEFLPYRR